MIELEKTYLAKELPEGLKSCKFKEIIDVYFPKFSEHPKIRLRKNGDKFELTKKEPVVDGDASNQTEQTIILDETEFESLSQQIEGKRVRKIRYFYDYGCQVAEFDIFQDDLEGLVLINFEFTNPDVKNSFQMPSFCLADMTQEVFVAGGEVCGKTYEDIKDNLDKFGYKQIYI